MRFHGKAGLSVIEVVLAVSLLALTLSGAYLLLTQVTRMLYQARDHYVAAALCLARIERARDIDYSLLSLLEDLSPGTRLDAAGVPDAQGSFRRETDVQVDTPDPGTTQVRVTTYILDRRSRRFTQEQEVMSCIFTEYLDVPE